METSQRRYSGSKAMRRLMVVIIAVLPSIRAHAQNFGENVPSIHNPMALKSFFERFDSGKVNRQTPVHVIHWGDSHIQMGYFARAMRIGIDSLFGGLSGHGMTFPYRAAGYNPFHSQTQVLAGTWQGKKIMDTKPGPDNGISGFVLHTMDTTAAIAFGVRGDNGPVPESNRLTIIYRKDTGTEVRFRGQHLKLDSTRLYEPILEETRNFQEDSTAFMVTTLLFDDNIDMVRLDITNHHPQNGFILWGASFEKVGNGGIIHHNCGVGGAQFSHLINSGSLHLKQATLFDPGLIILSFGSNESYTTAFTDSAYQKDIREYLSRLRSALPRASILLTGPPDTRSRNRFPRNTASICRILRETAERDGYAYFDIRDAMGGVGSILRWRKNGWASNDLLHFKPDGYARQAGWLTTALERAYHSYRER